MKKLFLICMLLTIPANLIGCGDDGNEVNSDNEDDSNNTVNNNDSDNNDDDRDPAGCLALCENRLPECGVSADNCGALCAEGFTAAELSCLNDLSCQELLSNPQVCEDNGPNNAFNNDGNNDGNNDTPQEGDSCQCDPNDGAPDGVSGSCEGTENGCGFSVSSPRLSCLHDEASGRGTCRYLCSSSDVGSQGSCPDGQTCRRSEFVDVTDQNWHVCQ